MVLNCMKTQYLHNNNCSPIGSLIPLNLLSWCVLSFPFPLPPAVCPCFIVVVCPSLPPFVAAWGTDSAADKAAAAAGRAKQYPGAHCSTAYATKHGWRQPKGQAPKDAPAGVCVSMCYVCHLCHRPLSICIQRIFFLYGFQTCLILRRKCATVGMISIKDYSVWSCLFIMFRDRLTCFQLFGKHVKWLETQMIWFYNQHMTFYSSSTPCSWSVSVRQAFYFPKDSRQMFARKWNLRRMRFFYLATSLNYKFTISNSPRTSKARDCCLTLCRLL